LDASLWGRALDVGCIYEARLEPDNIYMYIYIKNAIAVLLNGRTVGYLNRYSASYISRIFRSGIIRSKMIVKPKTIQLLGHKELVLHKDVPLVASAPVVM